MIVQNEELARSIRRRTLKPPLKSYLWRMELPVLDREGYVSGISFDDQLEVSSRVVSVSVPYDTLETDKANHGNSFWYFAKSVDIGSITMEVLEYEDGLTYKYFRAWQKLIANYNGTFNPPVVYKRDVRFFRLDTNKEDVLVDTYHNYFVSGIGESSNDYESNSLVRLTVTLTGDSVSREIKSVVGQERGFETVINTSKNTKTSLIEFLF